MRRSVATLLRLGLAGSALTTVAALHPAAAAAHGVGFTAADAIAPAAASQQLAFEVFLPLRNADALTALLARQQTKGSADYHKWLTPAEFASRFGTDQAVLSAVSAELRSAGFTVKPQIRSLKVSGTVAMVGRAFGAKLTVVRDAGQRTRLVALDGLKLSPTLRQAGAIVLAFNKRRSLAQPHSIQLGQISPDNRYGRDGAYWYDDLKQAYGYPAANATVSVNGTATPLDGTGTVIATMISSDILDSDVRAMFKHEKFLAHSAKPTPKVVHEYLAGAVPGYLSGDGFAEASLDVQMETGGAPGATTILYDIPDLSDESIAEGYSAIDLLNEVDVASSSFGECEEFFTPAFNDGIDYSYIPALYDTLFAQGNAQGITFLASSGDYSGKGCPSLSTFTGGPGRFITGLENPASDPNVTAVGGTNLVTASKAGKLDSAYKTENAWVDPLVPFDQYGVGVDITHGFWGAGGGASILFAKPAYQTVHTVTTMRSVPDVGMQVGGCPGGISVLPCNGGDKAINGNGNTDRSAVAVYLQGTAYGFIGTSVASPEFATVVALLVEQQGRQGNLNPYLYNYAAAQIAGTASPGFHNMIPGWNSIHPNTYPGYGYNNTTGLGTPYVATLVGLPAGTPLAGVPQSPSNP